jgi:hypothetical protein
MAHGNSCDKFKHTMLSAVVQVIAWLIVACSVGSFIANETHNWKATPNQRENYRKVRRYCLLLFILGVGVLVGRQFM